MHQKNCKVNLYNKLSYDNDHYSLLLISVRSFSSKNEISIGIIPGDGVGKEVIPAAEKVIYSNSNYKSF